MGGTSVPCEKFAIQSWPSTPLASLRLLGDPCEVARALEEAGADFTTYVIGFDVTEETAKAQLRWATEPSVGTKVENAASASRLLGKVPGHELLEPGIVYLELGSGNAERRHPQEPVAEVVELAIGGETGDKLRGSSWQELEMRLVPPLDPAVAGELVPRNDRGRPPRVADAGVRERQLDPAVDQQKDGREDERQDGPDEQRLPHELERENHGQGKTASSQGENAQPARCADLNLLHLSQITLLFERPPSL